MTLPPLLHLVAALADTARRPEGARQLAQAAGAQALLLLVRDPAVQALLPAAGMPQTLHGGPRWRALLQQCPEAGRHEADVDLQPGPPERARVLAGHGAALVFVGGAPRQQALDVLETLLPLLGSLLSAEQALGAARADAKLSRETAQRANALAAALEKARAEGARLNAALREEHVRKDEFLAMLAHELRNPLAPIVTSVEVMKHPALGEQRRRTQLAVVERQAGQLTRLVDDLLDVSRVSRGRIELRPRPLDLRDVLAAAVEATQPAISERGHQLQTDLPASPLVVEGDHVRLTQVFANLLHNAAKYTDPGGHLTLRAGTEGAQAVVEVVDDGIGIPPEMLPRVFDLFAQAPTALDRAQGGLGIGLTLVRRLVELHGGSVRADSAGPGQGSRFTVHLPLCAVDLASPPQRAGEAAGEPTQAAAALRVLLVDDNRDAADSLAGMLQLLGHQVSTAYSGTAGWNRAQQHDHDLVLLDLGLPGMDGYEVARSIRRAGGRQPYLVALTGYGTPRDRALSKAAGFDDHRVKPLSASDLLDIAVAASRHAV